MSKELDEAWTTIYHYNDEIIHDMGSEYVDNPLKEEIDIVNNALLELKAIKEANPSEALECFDRILHCNDDDYTQGYFNHDVNIIKQALQRLESIDNSKPSEALKDLECLYEESKIDNGWEVKHCITYAKQFEHNARIKPYYEHIKQALLKLDHLEFMMDLSPNQVSCINNREIFIMRKEMYEKYQEQETVLKIIKEKEVDVEYLNKCNDVKEYNAHWCYEKFHLTEKEFELLKAYFGKNIQK